MANAMLLGEVAELCFAAAREADPDRYGSGLVASARSRGDITRSCREITPLCGKQPTLGPTLQRAVALNVSAIASPQNISDQRFRQLQYDSKTAARIASQTSCGAALMLKAKAVEAELASFGIVESAATRRAANNWHRVALYDIFLCWCCFVWEAARIRNNYQRYLMSTLACLFTGWRTLVQKYARHRAIGNRLILRIKTARRSSVLQRWSFTVRSSSHAHKIKRQHVCKVLWWWSNWSASLQTAHRKVDALEKCLLMKILQLCLQAWCMAYQELQSLGHRASVCLSKSKQREGLSMLHKWAAWRRTTTEYALRCRKTWRRGSILQALTHLRSMASKSRKARLKASASNMLRLGDIFRHWAEAMSIVAQACETADEIIFRLDANTVTAAFYKWARLAMRRKRIRSAGISIQAGRARWLFEEWAALPRIHQFNNLQMRTSAARTVRFWNSVAIHQQETKIMLFNASVFYQRQLVDSVVACWRREAVASHRLRRFEDSLAYNRCQRIVRRTLDLWRSVFLCLRFVQTQVQQMHLHRSARRRVAALVDWHEFALDRKEIKYIAGRIANSSRSRALWFWSQRAAYAQHQKRESLKAYSQKSSKLIGRAFQAWIICNAWLRLLRTNHVQLKSWVKLRRARGVCEAFAQARHRSHRNRESFKAYTNLSSKLAGRAFRAWVVCLSWFRLQRTSQDHCKAWWKLKQTRRGWEALRALRPRLAYERLVARHQQHLARLATLSHLHTWLLKAARSRTRRSVANMVHVKQCSCLTRRLFFVWLFWVIGYKSKLRSLTTCVDANRNRLNITMAFAKWYNYAGAHVAKRVLLKAAQTRIVALRKSRVLNELRIHGKMRKLGQVAKKMYIRRWIESFLSHRLQHQKALRLAERQGSCVRKKALRRWHACVTRRVFVRTSVSNLRYQYSGRVARELLFAWISYLAEQRFHHMATEISTLRMMCFGLEAWSRYMDLVARGSEDACALLAKRDEACHRRCWYGWKHFVFSSWPAPKTTMSGSMQQSPLEHAVMIEELAQTLQHRKLHRALRTFFRHARIHKRTRQQLSVQSESTSSSTFEAWREYAVNRSRHDRAINEATLAKYNADIKKAVCTWAFFSKRSRRRNTLLQLAQEQFNGQMLMAALMEWRLTLSLQFRIRQLARKVLDRDIQASLWFCVRRWSGRIQKQKCLIQMTLHSLQIGEDQDHNRLRYALHSWRSTCRQIKWVRMQHQRLSQFSVLHLLPMCLSTWRTRSTKWRLKRERSSRAAKRCCSNAWHQAARHWHKWAARRRQMRQQIVGARSEWSTDALAQCLRAWLLYRIRKHHRSKLSATLTARITSIKLREAMRTLHLKAVCEKRIRQFAVEGAHKWARSSAHRCCRTLLEKATLRKCQHQVQERVHHKIKGCAMLSWRYGTVRMQGAYEVARRRAALLAKVFSEACFEVWLARTVEMKSCCEAAKEYASHRLVGQLQSFIHIWHLASQEKRKLFRLTLQVISCVAQKKQKLALHRWHSDARRRRLSQLEEEVPPDTPFSALITDGAKADNDILQLPSDWIDFDSGLSYGTSDSWDLIANSSAGIKSCAATPTPSKVF
mmetsp:Transcript_107866/g.168514  ORF Transcript_107866/g.168514 Transcript_107866/m.168514 type:complete len:1574 (+) Transcript_107866:68-4789(+)